MHLDMFHRFPVIVIFIPCSISTPVYMPLELVYAIIVFFID